MALRELKKWIVSGEVTISMSTIVHAATEADALKKAEGAPMMSLCHQCADGRDEFESEWRTSGEFDGEPLNLRAEEV